MDRVGCARSIIARPGLLAEPPGQKIVFDLQLTDLAVEFADLDFAGLVLPVAAVLEHAGRAVEQRLLPGMDLARVDTIFAGQFANRAIALDRRQGHLRLERRAMLLPRLLHDCSCFWAVYRSRTLA